MSMEAKSIDDLRRAFAAFSERAVPGSDCPSPDAIWEAVRGGSPARWNAGIVDHTSRCPACAEVWRLALDYSRGRASGVAPGYRARLLTYPSFRVVAALAASLVLAVAVALFVRALEKPSIAMRAGNETDLRSLVPEAATLHRGACTLRWSEPFPEATYTVRVGLEDFTSVVSAQDLDRPQFTIPPARLEKVPKGGVIVWRVEATSKDGRRLASQAFRNHVE